MTRSPFWWLLAIVGAAIGAFALYELVEQFQPTIQEAVNESKTNGQAEAFNILASNRVAYYTKALAIVTGGLAFFEVIQLYFLVRSDTNAANSSTAAKRSADIAQRALYYSNRAYLDVSRMHNEWNWAKDPKTGKITKLLKYRAEIINRGNTPAIQLNLGFFRWQDPTNPTLDMLDGLDKTLGEGYISPDTSNFSMDFFISEDDVKKVHSGEDSYWWTIYMAYRDVFEDTPDHMFQECRRLVFLADPEIAWDRARKREEPPDIIRWVPESGFSKVS